MANENNLGNSRIPFLTILVCRFNIEMNVLWLNVFCSNKTFAICLNYTSREVEILESSLLCFSVVFFEMNHFLSQLVIFSSRLVKRQPELWINFQKLAENFVLRPFANIWNIHMFILVLNCIVLRMLSVFS